MNYRKQYAFTMLEILIAVSIMTLIFSTAYRALNQIAQTKILLDDEREIIHVANSLLARLSRELQLALQTDKIVDPDHSEFFFRGQDETISGGFAGDQVIFVANDVGQYVPDEQVNSGLVMLSYRVARNSDKSAAQYQQEAETFLLVRDEIPNVIPFEQALEQRVTFPITNRLLSLNFAYFDFETKQWQAVWEEREKIPAMISIKLQLMTQRGRIMTFSTAVPIKAGIVE